MNAVALPYAEGKFVGREKEINSVITILRALRSGSFPEKRTVAFMGERGIGKSWILKHLHSVINKEFKDVVLFPLDLQKLSPDPILAILNALQEMRKCFPNLKGEFEGGTLAETSRRVLEEVREQLKEQSLVVLADHVYEADWKLLAGLEDYLLGPLAIEPNTLIVLSGRGREYPWKTPELRLKAEFKNLTPLNIEETAEQLRLQISEDAASHAKSIFEASGGNPLGNYLLGNKTNFEEGLNAIINAALEAVPAQKRDDIRTYLEALCVLRAFDEERIPFMLAANEPNKDFSKWKYADARKVRDDLVQGGFARWDEDKHGFVIDEMLRKSLENYIRNVDKERWKRLQDKAEWLYQDWIQKYPRAKEIWNREMEYHKVAMQTPAHI